ncbi:major facilitator superfamily domain-containing protein [Dioszegia hungarica]|uniref:Major facilitator superfamily domain-containing protein n=1 Tax=Dioszegia hungarica TaxID=4972 RepID=A0AA38H5V0_9TREE|nr:major facilitator superfamily domain-containing protein [Dioszegia hungarica]KAI9634765.1 major facilitator superfamily domain-containing protein [Dioszegia hungarica]
MSQSTPQPAHELSNTRLIVLGVGMLITYALGSAGILETSFALPMIQRELGLATGDAQWIASSTVLIWRGLLLGLAGHLVCNLAAVFMPNLASLNVFRALTGVCLSFMYPAAAGIVGVLYPAGRPRTLAFVGITCGGAAGAAGGQLLAGAFLEYLQWTWRACYLSLAVMSLFPLAINYFLVPADQPLETLKTLRLTSPQGWKVAYLPALLVIAATLFVGFVFRQRQLSLTHSPPPLIPATLLTRKNRDIIAIFLAAFATWASTDSIFVGISYLYFDILKLRPFEAGLKLSVTFFSGTVAAVLVALTISHVPPRLLIFVCCAVSSVSSILFAIRDVGWAYWKTDLWAFLVIAYGTDA